MTEDEDDGQPAENRLETARDDQTNKVFEVKREDAMATLVACISGVYLICTAGFLLWLLFDTWSGRNQLLLHFGYGREIFARASFLLMAYVAIGGALGATVDGIRSLISWHSEREAYGARFIWKDLSLPFVGAAIGIIVYVTVRGGVGVFNGDFSLSQSGSTPKLTAFAVASLSGFSCWQVFRWLDDKANQMFNVAKAAATGARTVRVPNLIGKKRDEADALLDPLKLKVGALRNEINAEHAGRIIKQVPAAGGMAARGDAVDLTVGIKAG